MEKPLVPAVIVTFGLVAAACLLSLSHRYAVVAVSGAGGYCGFEIDRLTGRTWSLSYEEKNLLKPAGSATDSDVPLPATETAKIVLGVPQAGNIDLYNGTSWTVTKIVVTETALDGENRPASNRDYQVQVVQGTPLTKGWGYWNPLPDGHATRQVWSVKQAFGLAPKN